MTATSRERTLSLLTEHCQLLDTGMHPYNPFGSSVWLRHFADQIVDDSLMEAIVVQHGSGAELSLMPLSRDPAKPWLLRGLCNYYSSLHSLLYTMRSDRADAANALARQLRHDHPGCAVLQLSPLSAEDRDTALVRAALARSGWYIKQFFVFGNWYLPCEGMSFDTYMKGRDSQLYNTWTRKSKKFKADGTGEARLQVVTLPDEVDAAMDAYETVYAKSWKKPEPYPDFVRGWARACAQEGWLRLGVAWIGDVPIAAQFWFTIDRRAYIFKLAYDEAFNKFSAGTVLTAHLMRQALDEDRVVEVDYLTGDDPYKKSWMSHRRERIGLLACNLRSACGLAHAARETATTFIRRFARPSNTATAQR
ncbi:GNAT family N-acetyltransferase [uncultured Piscinibacter sp.]|uniref:GNAT family N-acetyltransferase n=1 Tax=uncultured Piscinibacter sp. TaxID=1131835 RepID=UPI0026051C0C|nr:GNAT family N-acetyltransferase [uncultured Piscinibacter sp.]